MSNYNSQLQSNNTGLQEVLTLLQTKAVSGGEDALITRTFLTYTNDRVTNIGYGAFAYCTNLTSISFPKCSYIGDCAFDTCTELTLANFPKCSYIGKSAFQQCFTLTSINFPMCTSIGNNAFIYCNLKSVNFPVCSYIANSAFSNCCELSSLTLGASIVCTLSNKNAFNSTPYAGYSAFFEGTPHIYVPASLLTSYKTATNWTYFSSYFSSIESLDGQSPEGNLITFTIFDTEYQAEEGMTWGEWVNSEYNTDNYYIDGRRVTRAGYTYIMDITTSHIILDNGVYFIQMGHSGGADN